VILAGIGCSAPIPAVRGATIEPLRSTLSGHCPIARRRTH
jgi:hypothetical protein